MKKVKLLRFERYGEIRIGIYFRYNEHLKALAKKIGCYWSPEHKLWHLSDTPQNYQLAEDTFKDYLESTQLQVNKALRKKNIQCHRKNLTTEKRETLIIYQRYLAGKRYSINTIALYESMMELFLGYYYNIPLDAIDLKKVERYCEDIIHGGGYSISYHRQFIGALKLFCQRFDLPLVGLKDLRRPSKAYKLPTVLSKEEVVLIMQVTRNIKHRIILMLLYSTGMRISELLNLKQSDVSIARLQIKIRAGKGVKDRYVSFSEQLVPMYESYLTSFRPVIYVIEGTPGSRYSTTSVQKIIKKSVHRAGLKKNVSAHTFRHSYATHLLERGVSLRHIQELLGHTSSETTMIYTHISRQEAVGIVSPLDTLEAPDNFSNDNGKKFYISR